LISAVSTAGVLVFRSAPQHEAEFTVVDRNGRTVRTIGAPDSYTNFSLSPDESRIAAERRDPLTGRSSVWLIDAARGVTSIVTDVNDAHVAEDPTWTADGQAIAYRHGASVAMRSANGGESRAILSFEAYPDDFSRDGRYMTYGRPEGNGFVQWMIDLKTPGAAPQPLVTGVTLADEARIAPNGRWVAYHSNETGTAQVYVMPLPRTGQKWQLSPGGGVQPRWSRDGNELFYLDPNGRLMAVTMPGSDPNRASAPQVLFNSGLQPSDALDQIAPMSNGFLLRLPKIRTPDAAAVQVIVNWRPR
jgi:Tol biopolymer transport system component